MIIHYIYYGASMRQRLSASDGAGLGRIILFKKVDFHTCLLMGMNTIIQMMPTLSIVCAAILAVAIMAVPRRLPYAATIMCLILCISNVLLMGSRDRIALLVFTAFLAALHPALKWVERKMQERAAGTKNHIPRRKTDG